MDILLEVTAFSTDKDLFNRCIRQCYTDMIISSFPCNNCNIRNTDGLSLLEKPVQTMLHPDKLLQHSV